MSHIPDSLQLDPPLRLGVSTCLMGEAVRYDGGHKHDRYLTGVLGQYVNYVPVCPEVECGLTTPRESMRLVGDSANPRLVGNKTGTDFTVKMQDWVGTRLEELAGEGLHGFIFKKGSPSSGAFRVKVYHENGMPQETGSGLFAGAFMKRFPWLPVEEEGRLNDLPLRENFIDRIFAYYRFTQAMSANPTPGGLVAFHTGMKLTCMAHSPDHYKRLGQLVAKGSTLPWPELHDTYRELFMEGLSKLATRGKHANVLQHIMGFIKEELSSEDKQELLALVADYQAGIVPLIVPITLLKHHLHRHGVDDWVWQQVYLQPYPRELMLRNHV